MMSPSSFRLHACGWTLVAAVVSAAHGQPPATDLNRVFNDPTVSNPAADHLVVLVHGAASTPGAWAEDMAVDISNTFEALPDQWDVWEYDWQQDAATPIPPNQRALVSAKGHGQHLAGEILDGNYDYVHLVGHSLGGRVIQSASQVLAEAGGTDVHLTFLDAYTPSPVWVRTYGQDALYAEHYFSNETLVVFTNNAYPNAFNVDISALDTDPNRAIPSSGACNPFSPNFDRVACANANADNHEWPHEWYRQTITNPQPADLGLGYAQSKEGGGTFLGLDPPAPPQFVGTKTTLFPDMGPTVTNVPELDKILGPQLNPAASNPVPSAQDGTVVFDNDSIDLTATAGTPASLTVTIDLTGLDGVNSLEFDFDFFDEGPQDGVLTVFTENQETHQVWQRFALGPEQFSGEIILNTALADQDMLDLTFRLDVAGGAGSFVHIDDIFPGSVVPEPSSWILLSIAMAILAVRAARIHRRFGSRPATS